MKQMCLNCKNYRPEDEFSGRCRVDKDTLHHQKYPIMKHEDYCARWQDAGQQYYIRLGWLKNKEDKAKSPDLNRQGGSGSGLVM